MLFILEIQFNSHIYMTVLTILGIIKAVIHRQRQTAFVEFVNMISFHIGITFFIIGQGDIVSTDTAGFFAVPSNVYVVVFNCIVFGA